MSTGKAHGRLITSGERLRIEVDRIGISRAARALGVARNTIYNWCGKSNAPMNRLLDLANIGVDLLYVLGIKPRYRLVNGQWVCVGQRGSR